MNLYKHLLAKYFLLKTKIVQFAEQIYIPILTEKVYSVKKIVHANKVYDKKTRCKTAS